VNVSALKSLLEQSWFGLSLKTNVLVSVHGLKKCFVIRVELDVVSADAYMTPETPLPTRVSFELYIYSGESKAERRSGVPYKLNAAFRCSKTSVSAEERSFRSTKMQFQILA